jgi:HK97 family phage prohead protease
MATFVLNDETKVNSYGYRILNKGIDLKRFKANPVMLAQHMNNLWAVVGRWVNIRIEGDCLLADAEFDMDDEDAAKIAGKVERGFIKACSMGILFMGAYLKLYADGTYVLEKCELMENSIVAVPSNANAVRLFAENGEPMSEEQVQQSLSALRDILPDLKTQHNQMEKLTLSIAALSALCMEQAPTADQLSAAIVSLSADAKASKDRVTELTAELNLQKEAQGERTC